MLLRSITKHVKEQNWFAVALDFFIVIAGILIAFQITNWNEGRSTRVEAAEFQDRLLYDMKREAQNYKTLELYYADVRKAAETTLGGLTGETELSDKDLLVNAFRATQYSWFERYRSSYDEMKSSGKLGLIEDSELLARVSGYYSMNLLTDVEQGFQNSRYRDAFRMLLPPNIQFGIANQCGDRLVDAESGTYSFDYICDFDWPASDIETAAASLRADTSIVPLLRLQIIELDSARSLLLQNWDFFRLQDYVPKETAS